MITGRLPFHGASYEELFDAILKKDVVFPPTLSDSAKVCTTHLKAELV
jgi:hypothetical protein